MGIIVVFRKIELGGVMGELSSLNSRCNWLFRGGKSCLSWLGLSLSYYYFYKTDSRTRKKAFLYAIIETIGAFFTRW